MTHWSKRHTIVPASYVIFERDGKILLMCRKGHYMEGYYTMPAGHFDGEEGAKRVAAREAKEEVNLDVAEEDLVFAHCMVYRAIEGDHDRVSFFFKAKKFTGEPKIMEPDKCSDLKWVAWDQLPEKMTWEAKHGLNEIAKGNFYSEVRFQK